MTVTEIIQGLKGVSPAMSRALIYVTNKGAVPRAVNPAEGESSGCVTFKCPWSAEIQELCLWDEDNTCEVDIYYYDGTSDQVIVTATDSGVSFL